jgi:hypothetical protein
MSALIFPHPAMSAAQCDLVCRREGLATAHFSHDRIVLVQTSAPREALLRIEAPDPSTLHKRRLIRALHEEIEKSRQLPGPEAA